jgi:SAM-dependent methyltransferase
MAATDNGVLSMSDDFYRAFEEKYRGPRELILSRLAIYRPFISSLTTVYPASPAVDLGCGRGEWLELLLDEGFSPLGIDQDEGMLQGCHEHNLPAQQGDAVAYLATLADDSQTIISAFHVVEHILFDQLRTLVSEALRVLKPGGLLIMETPNPENIVVATRNFYLDPTHQRPLPPQLLSFLPEYYGFARTKILRIQESKEHATNVSPTLNDVLAGASPDYAVIAQKTAPAETLDLFDKAFNQEYGLSLNTLADRYDASIEARATQAEACATQAEARATQAEACATQAEARATQAEACASQAEARATQAEACASQAEAARHQALQQGSEWHERVIAIHNSISWKITKPLRVLGQIVQRQSTVAEVSLVLGAKMKQFLRVWTVSTIKWAGDRAQSSLGFKRFALRLLRGHPGLQQKLSRVYLENQYKDQPQPVNWSGTSSDAVKPLHPDVAGNKKSVIPQFAPSGINADQCTPLESSFHTYCGRP